MGRRTVVITGATSGIGRAAVVELLLAGADVVMLSRTRERATAAGESVSRAVGERLAIHRERRALQEAARARSRARSERQARFDIPTGLAAAYAEPPDEPNGPDRGSRDAEDDAETDSRQPDPPAPGDIMQVICDLASAESVRAAADVILSKRDRIDVLINNAAVRPRRRGPTSVGGDPAFHVNHLGHFLLTNLLLPRLEASAPARIILVTCAAGLRMARRREVAERPQREGSLRSAYDKSKRANILHARELDLRLRDRGVGVAAVDPGRTATKLGSAGRDDLSVGRKIVHAVLWPWYLSPERAAEALARLADPDALPEAGGRVYRGSRDVGPLEAFGSLEAATALWAFSAEQVGDQGHAT